MNVNPAYQNFTGGELSPKMYGRTNTQQYNNGTKVLKNFLCETQGAVTYRGGLQYVSGTKDNNKAFLWRFQYSDEVAYILEFTEFNIRLYRDRGVVLDGGSSPIDIATPYTEEDIFQLKFAQDGINLYVVHPSYKPRKLVRLSEFSWSLGSFTPSAIIPSIQTRVITGITQANPAVVTYTGSDNFLEDSNVRLDNVVGMVEVNGNTYTIANLDTGAKTFELLGIDSTGFTAYVSGGNVEPINDYPSAVAFYEQRLVFGGSVNNPETLWFSKSAELLDFTIGTNADDGMKYTVSAGEDSNKIEWIKGTEDFLAIGGFGDILRATGGQGQEAITPTSISIKPTNTMGVADINPIGTNQVILFMQRNQLVLHSLELEALTGNYKPIDRNLFADHITKSGVTQMAFQDGRPDVVWCVLTDGGLRGLTMEIDQEVSGWHRHDTNGEFISVATSPRVKEYDTLWACVKRNINGIDNYYIEYMNDLAEFPDPLDFITSFNKEAKLTDNETYQRALFESQKKYIHLDSALTFDGSVRISDASSNLTLSAVSGTGITCTASTAVFVAGDVGKQIWIKSVDGTSYGRAEITAYTSSTIVTAEAIVDFDTTGYSSAEWYITANSLSGLDHLEGEEVSIVVDGAIHPKKTVTSGSITLDTQASVVHVGFGYTGILETLNIDGGAKTGSAQTKKKSISEIGFRLYNTSGLSFGTDYYNLEDRLLRQAIDLMDNPPPLFTGDEVLQIRDSTNNGYTGYAREKRVIFVQELPLPANIQLVTPYFNLADVR